jgi:hypothetical protein
MAAMTLPRVVSLVSAVLVGASVSLAPIASHAGPGPSEDAPIEGPARPPRDAPGEQPDGPPADPPAAQPTDTPPEPDAPTDAPPGKLVAPPPTFDPGDSPGIEFVIPPPASEDDHEVTERDPPLAATFPDPGVAPNDGNSMLVLSGTTMGLTLLGFSSLLTVGIQRQTPLEWLLPATIVPAAGLLAISTGGLYLGIKRARAHHRWELANRVGGEPQGAGLSVGGTFMLLGALFFIPSGAFALQTGEVESGASMIAIGSLAFVSMPIMFTLGARRARDYARTGGWHRRAIPQIPGESQVRLRITPLVAPTVGGVTLGAAGQF